MIKHWVPVFALAVAQAASAAGPSTAASPVNAAQSEKFRAWRAAAAQTLEARADASSLAAAAALRFMAPAAHSEAGASKSAAVDLAAKASELDPQNSCIGWLRLQLCANTPGCDVRDAATALRWVDADNGAAWLSTLTQAEKDKDTMEVDRVLADMTQGSRFDLYWNPTVVLLFDTLRKARAALPTHYLPSDVARLQEAQDIAGVEIIPPLAPVMNACRDAVAERRESCVKLAKIMQSGDTVLAQLIGMSLERRLAHPDSKEARAIAERRRVLEWRVATATQYEAPLLPWLKNARARARIAKMRTLPREEDVDIAILRGGTP